MKETSVTAFLTKVGLKKSDSKLVEDKFDVRRPASFLTAPPPEPGTETLTAVRARRSTR